jgi:hypothetical protein
MNGAGTLGFVCAADWCRRFPAGAVLCEQVSVVGVQYGCVGSGSGRQAGFCFCLGGFFASVGGGFMLFPCLGFSG